MRNLFLCLSIGLFPALSGASTFDELVAPAFETHCVRCHGQDGKVKGKVDLLAIESRADLLRDPDLLQTLIDVLEAREMPPEDETQPDPALRDRLATHLRGELRVALEERGSFAPVPIRRMNRFQYANAVQDLFRLDRVVFALPERMMREHGNYFRPETGIMPDVVKVGSRPLGKSQMIEPRLRGVAPFPQDLRAEHGYDNRADHLSLSPLLMESFLTLGRSVVESASFTAKTCRIWPEFFAQPKGEFDPATEVRRRLDGFLTRAFRGPVEDELLERYTGHVLATLESGTAFPDAMKEAAAAAIASPRFLYLYDEGPAGSGDAEPVTGHELASRLSFFLWGSLPDDELLARAADGTLVESAVLSDQVDRMLRDRRVRRFCERFPAQWLQLDHLVSSVPDEQKFKDFYYAAPNYRTSMDMMMEPLLLFETVLVENHSVLDLVDSRYSYRSVRLRRWYGEEVGGNPGGPVTLEFRRVPVPDRRQGGVITSAAVLTMTSGPEESKPITRGAWVAGVIFNQPPEPPPADVPPLEEGEDDATRDLPLRERFAAHRERADCAGCHARIDPLGFALENYDAVGRWRDAYADGKSVDASGTLFRTRPFAGAVEFKDAILAEKDRFARAFTEHLLSYALARGLTAADSPAVEHIVASTAAGGYRLHDLIRGVALSDPFRHKTGQEPSSP